MMRVGGRARCGSCLLPLMLSLAAAFWSLGSPQTKQIDQGVGVNQETILLFLEPFGPLGQTESPKGPKRSGV